MPLLTTLTIAASLLTGLVGGVFFAFSGFVMRALFELPAAQGIAAMRRINITVITPLFLGSFLGALPLLAGAAFVAHAVSHTQQLAWLALSSIVYAVGSIAVTMLFNVPLNNQLAALRSDSAEAAGYWPHYVRAWLFWNHVRCVASLVPAGLAAFSLTATGATPITAI